MEFDEEGRVKVPLKNSVGPKEDKKKVKSKGFVKLNPLAQELSKKIEQLGKDIVYKDMNSMRCFYLKIIKHKNGLCWIEPHKDGRVRVYFRKNKEEYDKLDSKNPLFIASYGDYPAMDINSFTEIDYVLKFIKLSYEKWKNEILE